jgi:hypothetical protein
MAVVDMRVRRVLHEPGVDFGHSKPERMLTGAAAR